MHFLSEYGLFVAKTITAVIAILFLVASILGLMLKNKSKDKDALTVKKINKKFADLKKSLQKEVLNKKELKAFLKSDKQQAKQKYKTKDSTKRLFLLRFDGDIRASATTALREEITAILMLATPKDEVLVCLESGGGLVSNYGLAASQLARLKQQNIPLTIAIDKVAASGGYMMACVANKILAAPFAIIGSIGVIAQLPNFNRWLKKHDIDFEQLTAGEYKRTLTTFGENTAKARNKMQEEIEDIHELFKQFIKQHRPQVELEKTATGEFWFGQRALELNLIDAIQTSDDYLFQAFQREHNIVEVKFLPKQSLKSKLASAAQSCTDGLFRIF